LKARNSARAGGEFGMLNHCLVFGYFGPEVQFPLVSLAGAILGVVLMAGGAPVRTIRRWLSTKTKNGNTS
jgi:hypothetical protein